jgi:hypothetical protein
VTLRNAAFVLLGAAVVALAAGLARQAPSPGPLASAHAGVPGLAGPDGCEQCHADEGLAAGCTGCHREVGRQLANATGWHGARVDRGVAECERCHGDHWGGDYPLVSARAWGGEPTFASVHAHAPFELAGAHAPLTCDRCHAAGDGPRTYLGLSQQCVSCHADPHGAAMSDDCAACHSQDAFVPAARFEHTRRFPLLGPHEQVACVDCHPGAKRDAPTTAPTIATTPLDFASVRGKRCEECHDSPHRAPLPGRCDDCHRAADLDFAAASLRLPAAAHAASGFELVAPHADVACDRCHAPGEPFAARYPGRRADGCVACHRSPHGGQFGAREEGCALCHGASFAVSSTTAANHQPPLTGAHVAAECSGCHRAPHAAAPVRFVATPAACPDCHADPHGGQFVAVGETCNECHDTTAFVPSRFDFAARHPPLDGSHARVGCAECHKPPFAGAPIRWSTTPTTCAKCHADPHAGQFSRRRDDCSSCHGEERFAPSTITASRHQPPLAGAHRAVACVQCHEVDARKVARFAGTPRDCKSCHADPHAGQLTRAGNDCSRCHLSEERWLPVTFDHQRDARFALDGVHARLDCTKCHARVALPDGREVVHYAPLGVECRDCHTGK